jgi:hypothetical protein
MVFYELFMDPNQTKSLRKTLKSSGTVRLDKSTISPIWQLARSRRSEAQAEKEAAAGASA